MARALTIDEQLAEEQARHAELMKEISAKKGKIAKGKTALDRYTKQLATAIRKYEIAWRDITQTVSVSEARSNGINPVDKTVNHLISEIQNDLTEEEKTSETRSTEPEPTSMGERHTVGEEQASTPTGLPTVSVPLMNREEE